MEHRPSQQDDSDDNSTNDEDEQASGRESPQPSTPSRRRPPLDLDSALKLQSQASLVQEPNINKRINNINSSLQELSKNSCNHNVKSQATIKTNSQQELLAKQQQAVFREASVLERWNNYGINNYNISVDYIDCLSNNDLGKQPSSRINPRRIVEQNQQQQQEEMRFLSGGATSSSKKHHFRFQHRNRVEPSSAAASRSNETCQQQKVAAYGDTGSASASGGDSLPDAGILDTSTFPTSSRTANFNINTNKSCLYPISVSEVKKRTYFIGQLSQDSLLGHDELYRYFPNGRVSIFVCTWNQNRKRAPMNLNDLLLPDQLVYMPDIYSIGIQEAYSSQQDYLKEWEIELQTTLGPNHVLLHSSSLGTLHLSIFIRRDLIWFCSIPEESLYNSRSMPTNMIKTKGAVSISFKFFGTSFMFTNCHFPANENKLKERIDEYQRIIQSINLPKNLKLLKPRYLSNDSTARFDCVFFMGDLNFRLEQRTFDETISILNDILQSKEPQYEALTQYDELLKVMESNQAFYGFDECQIKFPPTYKFLAKTNKYDKQTKRVPSYTDRILFRSKRQRHIQCLIYDWIPQLISSDHKPVYCLFDVLVRPGRDTNHLSSSSSSSHNQESLNAGLFQRAIYLEALKRRSEYPNSLRDNNGGQEGGSFICSIS